jgi:3-dehydroquinate dehydratase-2
MKPIFVLNGPNLNLLGEREPEMYGGTALSGIEERLRREASAVGLGIDFRQTNHEGVLVDWTQEARLNASALILNAGAYTHSSIALLDALRAVSIPVIEVHLTNIFRREPYRRRSYISEAATGIICGFGPESYGLALTAVIALLSAEGAAGRGPLPSPRK